MHAAHALMTWMLLSAASDVGEPGAGSRPANEESTDPAAPPKSLNDYLLAAALLHGPELQPPVGDNLLTPWLLGACCAPLGGHIWAPLFFFKDAPANEARRTAVKLGGLGLLVSHSVLCLLPCVPIAFVPVLNFPVWLAIIVGMSACQAYVNWYVIPKAVALAYQDAFRMGGPPARKPDDLEAR